MGYLDADGALLRRGDTVILLEAPKELLAGLPEEDQASIKAQIGRQFVVEGFDNFGNVELSEFTGSDGGIHWIWVDPLKLRKV